MPGWGSLMLLQALLWSTAELFQYHTMMPLVSVLVRLRSIMMLLLLIDVGCPGEDVADVAVQELQAAEALHLRLPDDQGSLMPPDAAI